MSIFKCAICFTLAFTDCDGILNCSIFKIWVCVNWERVTLIFFNSIGHTPWHVFNIATLPQRLSQVLYQFIGHHHYGSYTGPQIQFQNSQITSGIDIRTSAYQLTPYYGNSPDYHITSDFKQSWRFIKSLICIYREELEANLIWSQFRSPTWVQFAYI